MSATMPTVTVCRGCCCGTRKKHPDVDHDAQLDVLRDSLRDVARVRTSDCLDDCKRSNVVVVSPSRAGRAEGGRPIWLQKVLTTSAVHAIGDWIRAGGPGVVSAPPDVERHVYRPGASTKKAVAKAEKKSKKKKG